jgi:hypothetical protein
MFSHFDVFSFMFLSYYTAGFPRNRQCISSAGNGPDGRRVLAFVPENGSQAGGLPHQFREVEGDHVLGGHAHQHDDAAALDQEITVFDEGKLEGIREGELKGKLEVARNLLANKVPLDVIVQSTGLSLDNIQSLK